MNSNNRWGYTNNSFIATPNGPVAGNAFYPGTPNLNDQGQISSIDYQGVNYTPDNNGMFHDANGNPLPTYTAPSQAKAEGTNAGNGAATLPNTGMRDEQAIGYLGMTSAFLGLTLLLAAKRRKNKKG
jgi:LPXTG-motif cell wall-anchored protein